IAADGIPLVVEVWELQPMRLRGRAEVPNPRAPGSGDERVPFTLVERPVADMRACGVADVAGLEEQQGPQLGGLKLLMDPCEPVPAESLEVDPYLPVDRLRARRWSGRDRELVRHDASFVNQLVVPRL